jgi:hypothetical protein
MCLRANPIENKKLRESFPKTFYKVVLKYCKFAPVPGLRGPFFCGLPYVPGWNKSDCNSADEKYCSEEDSAGRFYDVHRGVHICNSIEVASDFIKDHGLRNCSTYNVYVIRVTVDETDFLGTDGQHSAFKKVHLSEDEYQKALANHEPCATIAFTSPEYEGSTLTKG